MPPSRHLKSQMYTLSKTEKGYVISPTPIKGLVISGAGAKGLGYAGMIQALHQRDIIKGITHVGGASSGAITASFLAIGMSSETITKILSQLNLYKLLDNEGIMRRAAGVRIQNIFELFYVYQIKQHIKGMEKPHTPQGQISYNILKQKITIYEYTLKTLGFQINSIDDVINLSNSTKKLKALDSAFSFLHKTTKTLDKNSFEPLKISFNDLIRLRALLPESQKHLIKNLSVVTTNHTQKTIETFNGEHGGDLSIAEKTQQSGAHPILFNPARNAQGEEITDGGIINNMPTKALKNAGLKTEEILCVKAETAAKFEKRVHRAQNHALEFITRFDNFLDSFIKYLIGGRLIEGGKKVLNREKVFYHLGNMLYINTLNITTTTTSPTPEQKQKVITTAYRQTQEFLNGQSKNMETALIAMLYLGVDNLNHTLLYHDENHELFRAAAQAKHIFLLQNALVDELKNNEVIEHNIKEIEDILKIDSGLNKTQQDQAMALCLKQINYFSEGLLEQYFVKQIKAEEKASKISWFKQLLELLWKPIEWVLSIFSNPKPNEVKNKIELNLKASDNHPKMTPLRMLGFLNNKERPQNNSKQNLKIINEDINDNQSINLAK